MKPISALALGVCLLAGLAPHLSAVPPDGELRDARRRHQLVEHIRIADADRLIDQPDEISAYLAAHFNTIVLYDTEDDGSLKSEERIIYETGFARDHSLHVIFGKATKPPVSDDEIRQRLALWDRYGDDLILGAFFLTDDACSDRVPVERQRHLYEIAKETVPDWVVFGMIGAACRDLPSDEASLYFDPNAFDDLILLLYPLAIGEVRQARLELTTTADRDQEMTDYVRGYVEDIGEKFFGLLRPGQIVLLVIQAYAYGGENEVNIPRADDLAIQAAVGTQTLQTFAGQASNRSIAYFLWDGARAGMLGLWQRPDWIGAAGTANRRIEASPDPIDRGREPADPKPSR